MSSAKSCQHMTAEASRSCGSIVLLTPEAHQSTPMDASHMSQSRIGFPLDAVVEGVRVAFPSEEKIMLHHVSVGVQDVARAATFYDPVLRALGYKRVMEFMPYAIGYGERGAHPEFWIQLPHNQQTATAGNGTHVGFAARTK